MGAVNTVFVFLILLIPAYPVLRAAWSSTEPGFGSREARSAFWKLRVLSRSLREQQVAQGSGPGSLLRSPGRFFSWLVVVIIIWKNQEQSCKASRNRLSHLKNAHTLPPRSLGDIISRLYPAESGRPAPRAPARPGDDVTKG